MTILKVLYKLIINPSIQIANIFSYRYLSLLYICSCFPAFVIQRFILCNHMYLDFVKVFLIETCAVKILLHILRVCFLLGLFLLYHRLSFIILLSCLMIWGQCHFFVFNFFFLIWKILHQWVGDEEINDWHPYVLFFCQLSSPNFMF